MKGELICYKPATYRLQLGIRSVLLTSLLAEISTVSSAQSRGELHAISMSLPRCHSCILKTEAAPILPLRDGRGYGSSGRQNASDIHYLKSVVEVGFKP